MHLPRAPTARHLRPYSHFAALGLLWRTFAALAAAHRVIRARRGGRLRYEILERLDLRGRVSERWPRLAASLRAGVAGVQALLGALRHVGVLRHHALVERRRLEGLRERHRGSRCFVIGNGPSLRQEDLRALERECTFVTNHFYLHPQLGTMRPTYYCVSDLSFFASALHPQWADHLSRFPAATVFFLPAELRRRVGWSRIRERPDVYYLRCNRTRKIWRLGAMSVDATRVFDTGDSVVLDFCLPLAHFMGFSEVYLLGCDTDYGTGADAAHFYTAPTPSRSSEYHRAMWYPNVTGSYAVARRVFEASGRRIYNATAGGRLEVFPRVRLQDVLERCRS